MNLIKRLVLPLVLSLILPVLASAHSATLTFTKSVDDTGATGSGYTAWRQAGTCPASITSTTGFTQLNTTLFTVNSYTDSTVTPGTWCYTVTFSTSSASSVPASPGGQGTILPAAPTNVTISGSN